MLKVERTFLVCDWRGIAHEPADTPELGVDCPSCHAPTERTRILASRSRVPNEHAVALGRLGGLKGGRARATALTPSRRREIACAAAIARWR
jgi:hypothetical protein